MSTHNQIQSQDIRFDLVSGKFVVVDQTSSEVSGQVSQAEVAAHPERFLTAADVTARIAPKPSISPAMGRYSVADGPSMPRALAQVLHAGYKAVYDANCTFGEFVSRGMLSWRRGALLYEMANGKKAMDEVFQRTQTEKQPQRYFPMRDGPAVPWDLAEVIYAGYVSVYGKGHRLDRLAEHCGFRWMEVVQLHENAKARQAMHDEMIRKGFLPPRGY